MGGGAIGVLLWARWRRMFNLTLLDICAPGLAIGYAVGRIGCQLSGDGDYGIAWDGPWAMAYPDGTEPTTETVHPTPIYETLAMGPRHLRPLLGGCGSRFAPVCSSPYLVLAGAERFLIEFIRRNDDVAVGLTQARLISVAMILAGGVLARGEGQPRRAARRAGSGRPDLEWSATARRRSGSRRR